MRLNTSTQVLDYAGEPIRKDDGSRLTFRDVFMGALNNTTRAEAQSGQGAELKSKIFALATKLWSADEVDLTVDQLALIKERAGELSTPLVYGRICAWLDGETVETHTASEDNPEPANAA